MSAALLTPGLRTAKRRLTRLAATMSFNNPNEVVIVSGARTPVGNFQGALKGFTAPQLGVIAVKKALEKAKVNPDLVEELYMGHVIQANVGQSPARQVVIGAGLPQSTEATTVNKVCASGMKAITMASQAIQLGHRSVMIAGGMESMSQSPYYLPRVNPTFGHVQMKDSLLVDGLWDVYNDFHMGQAGEKAAKDHQISREMQDDHAIQTYRRAEEAWKKDAFKEEIAPIEIVDKKGNKTVVDEDEAYKVVKYEKIPTLKPVFAKDGTITAANASAFNDGASAVVLMSTGKAQELGVKPLAKIVSYADAAIAPEDFPIAPTVALPLALKKAGLTKDDISLFEINEAFSVVVRACEKVLGLDPAKVNIKGGAVALGHAIGNSGCRIVITLAHSLEPGQYGAAAVCNGGGGASAIIIQRL
ncbi:hypothetical protein DACRYDRAFT_25012 [Dacryopinax primogenitus]|uniref:acetyl-CoA C-acetyltransferase n=1 Tax=Dacryopinax primogenitus (strain DJM 731) TaxID=1858805 RepID=M5FRL2_DACPD|nr:uncharacterized protein DACRYDRAFT_25012 [Dacryopinax primogenitus]EJT97639.1 hypothetical protein DACRYDRAFT_25012 [Dacryopinax primogenitus]